jgi:hypothetical protein
LKNEYGEFSLWEEEMKHTYTYCKDCKWWYQFAEHGANMKQGECRRYPPAVFFTGRVYQTFCEVSNRGFPITAEDWWCGESKF